MGLGLLHPGQGSVELFSKMGRNAEPSSKADDPMHLGKERSGLRGQSTALASVTFSFLGHNWSCKMAETGELLQLSSAGWFKFVYTQCAVVIHTWQKKNWAS